MRNLKLFNLIVVIGATLFTLNALAASPVKVHVMENLSKPESAQVKQSLVKLGYAPSQKPLFTESKDAIIITKALATETEKESLTVEIMHLESDKSIPHKVFEYRLSNTDVNAAMEAFPKPEMLHPLNSSMPVAYQMQE